MAKFFMLFLTWMPIPLQLVAYGVFAIFFVHVVLRILALIWDALPLA